MKDPEETDEPKSRNKAQDNNRPRRNLPLEPEAPAAPTRNKVYLGVQLEALNDGAGVQVVEVADGSPAAKAGVELEDIIIKVDGAEVTENRDIVTKVQGAKAGDKLKLTVKRGSAQKELEVTLAPAP
jgi:S1-C subfamily serine protease